MKRPVVCPVMALFGRAHLQHWTRKRLLQAAGLVVWGKLSQCTKAQRLLASPWLLHQTAP